MARTAPTDFEREAWDCGLRHVVGLDEVGCGPLAGPVVAGAVVLRPRSRPIEGVFDSKALSAKQREAAAIEIRECVFAWALGAASTREIERLNIRRATILAMRRAIARLPVEPERLLVDGRRIPELGDHTAIIQGDRKSLSIACASILAKVVRDRLMRSLGSRYPEYGWETNKGYATGMHLAAIHRLGPTPHHRATWSPVAQRELFEEAVVGS
ncbi:MAG: ribonuclease HII [Gemmatimonadota bacterium]|nr:ribonuclease HII [Gemmatimonadota bacterium]MDH3428252.1 ribonuclease HII [Gemmatimonadota bacterium]